MSRRLKKPRQSKAERMERRSKNYLRFTEDHHRLHPDLVATVATVKPADTSKLLTVRNEFWTACAVWKRKNGVWSCTMSDPQLRWMVGKTPGQVQIELLKLGANWSWDGPLQFGMDTKSGADDSDRNPSPLGTAIPLRMTQQSDRQTGLPMTSQEWKPEDSTLVTDQTN